MNHYSSFRIPMLRADLYQVLAESLAEPPAWLALPGREWPLFEIVARLAPESEAARRAVEPLAEIPTEPSAARRARYHALFVGPGRPRLWLYESAHRSGRVLGPETFAVERFYRAGGLEVASAELPDHASVELAFLAYLAERGADQSEREFIEKHAGRWLPELSRALADSGDEVYAPIGQLLADWLEERAGGPVTGIVGRATRRSSLVTRHSSLATRLPVVLETEACTLCGFCVQVCPTRALAIRETTSETRLVLNVAACVGCGKCERVCEAHALSLAPSVDGQPPPADRITLRRSPRPVCRGCGTPMVSRAELDFVAAQIGHPAWLDYCAECRPLLMETQR